MAIKHLSPRSKIQILIKRFFSLTTVLNLVKVAAIVAVAWLIGWLIHITTEDVKMDKIAHAHESNIPYDSRIVKEYNYDGIYIYIVKGHEYICTVKGGIIHSESCSCKNNK